jgi:hypothetical protein
VYIIIRRGREREGVGRAIGREGERSIAPIIFNLCTEERLMVSYIASSLYWS